ALRSQQAHPPSDDRVTLADLTLVAAASSTQQLAASPAGASASGGAAPQASTGRRTAHGSAAAKDPEAERREIEELARHVLDAVERMCDIARERSGDPWET